MTIYFESLPIPTTTLAQRRTQKSDNIRCWLSKRPPHEKGWSEFSHFAFWYFPDSEGKKSTTHFLTCSKISKTTTNKNMPLCCVIFSKRPFKTVRGSVLKPRYTGKCLFIPHFHPIPSHHALSHPSKTHHIQKRCDSSDESVSMGNLLAWKKSIYTSYKKDLKELISSFPLITPGDLTWWAGCHVICKLTKHGFHVPWFAHFSHKTCIADFAVKYSRTLLGYRRSKHKHRTWIQADEWFVQCCP